MIKVTKETDTGITKGANGLAACEAMRHTKLKDIWEPDLRKISMPS